MIYDRDWYFGYNIVQIYTIIIINTIYYKIYFIIKIIYQNIIVKYVVYGV